MTVDCWSKRVIGHLYGVDPEGAYGKFSSHTPLVKGIGDSVVPSWAQVGAMTYVVLILEALLHRLGYDHSWRRWILRRMIPI